MHEKACKPVGDTKDRHQLALDRVFKTSTQAVQEGKVCMHACSKLASGNACRHDCKKRNTKSLRLRGSPRHLLNCRPVAATLATMQAKHCLASGTHAWQVEHCKRASPRVGSVSPRQKAPWGGTCLPGAAAGWAARPAALLGRFVPEQTGAQQHTAALRPLAEFITGGWMMQGRMGGWQCGNRALTRKKKSL